MQTHAVNATQLKFLDFALLQSWPEQYSILFIVELMHHQGVLDYFN